MAWDLTKYDDTKDPTQQTVLQNYGTFIHPNGEVRRTIVFGHQATGQRMMVNLSDTHARLPACRTWPIRSCSQLSRSRPTTIKPFSSETTWWRRCSRSPATTTAPTRICRSSGCSRPAAISMVPLPWPASQWAVQQAMKHGNQLLLFRYLPYDSSTAYNYYYQQQTQVLVYDLTDPTHPRRGGSVVLPSSVIPYYPYWCGWEGYWAIGFNGYGNWTEVESGLVTVNQGYNYDYTNNTSTYSRVWCTWI